MTIVHVLFSFGVGGAENLVVDLLNHQVAAARVCLLVINRRYSPALLARIDPRVEVTCLDREEGNKWNLGPLLRGWRYLRARRPDVLHCHDHDLMKLLWPWRATAVLTVHNVGVPTTYLRRYRRVFAISEAVQQDLKARGYAAAELVHNGIDFGAFTKKTDYAAPMAGVRLIQVSRLLHAQKGQDVALRALHELVQDPAHARTTLTLVGEGPSLGYLQQLVRELALEAHVVFAGAQDRAWVMANLCTFDVLIQPSLFEGFGLTVLEGLAAGLPVVATATDGPAEILAGLPAGFLFAPSDSAGLVQQLRHAVALYGRGEAANAVAASARAVKGRFSIQTTAANYLRLYPRRDALTPAAVADAPAGAPLRVLLVGPSMQRTKGGMATVIGDLLRAELPGVAFRHIVSHVEGSALEKLGYAARGLLAFARARAVDVDVVHLHVASGASFYRKSLFVLLARLRGTPAVLHVHGADFDDFYQQSPGPLRAYTRFIFGLSAKTLVLSASWQAFFQQRMPGVDVAVLHNGVHPDRFAAEAPTAPNTQFLFLGRLGARKGVYDLLDAVALLAARNQAQGLHVLLAGDGEEAQVRAAIVAKSLQPYFTVLGWVDEQGKAGLFKQVASLVLPSYHEGLPMALLEAMAAGKVIISTRVGGIPDLVEHGENGFLLAPGDVEALAGYLHQVGTSPDLVRQMGGRNIQKINAGYNLAKLNDQLAKLYRTLAPPVLHR